MESLKPETDFNEYFPKTMEVIKNFNIIFKLDEVYKQCSDITKSANNRHKKYDHYLRHIHEFYPLEIDKEISSIIPEWNDLKTISKGHVNIHTLWVLYLTTINEEFLKMTPFE